MVKKASWEMKGGREKGVCKKVPRRVRGLDVCVSVSVSVYVFLSWVVVVGGVREEREGRIFGWVLGREEEEEGEREGGQVKIFLFSLLGGGGVRGGLLVLMLLVFLLVLLPLPLQVAIPM